MMQPADMPGAPLPGWTVERRQPISHIPMLEIWTSPDGRLKVCGNPTESGRTWRAEKVIMGPNGVPGCMRLSPSGRGSSWRWFGSAKAAATAALKKWPA